MLSLSFCQYINTLSIPAAYPTTQENNQQWFPKPFFSTSLLISSCKSGMTGMLLSPPVSVRWKKCKIWAINRLYRLIEPILRQSYTPKNVRLVSDSPDDLFVLLQKK